MGYEDPGTEHDEERHYRARKRACQQARTSHLRRIDRVELSSYSSPACAAFYKNRFAAARGCAGTHSDRRLNSTMTNKRSLMYISVGPAYRCGTRTNEPMPIAGPADGM